MVTHDIAEAVYLSDRVLVMASGPGRITAETVVEASRPRDRRAPCLARQEAVVLSQLHGGALDFHDLGEEFERPHVPGPVSFDSLMFSV